MVPALYQYKDFPQAGKSYIPHMDFWNLSVESSTVRVGPADAESWLIFTKAGTSMVSSPSGPFTFTVDIACARFPFIFAGVTVKETPGGMDSGSDPILERHGEVVAKLREAVGGWKAGKRNSGIDSDGDAEGANMLRAQRRRA